jgi:hypothetical protein
MYRKMKKNEWIKVAKFLHWFFVTEEKEPKDYTTISDDIKNLIYTVNKEVNFDDMENDEQSVRSNGQANSKQTNLNDFEGSGEF